MTIQELLLECERLDAEATPGEWKSEAITGDWGFPFSVSIKTPTHDPSLAGEGITLCYGGVIQCTGSPDPRNAQSAKDGDFIARSRTLLPLLVAVIKNQQRRITCARVGLRVAENDIATGVATETLEMMTKIAAELEDVKPC